MRTTVYAATPDELAAIDAALNERNPGFTEAEWSVLVVLVRATIAADRYPLSPRIRMLKAILKKIEASAPRPEPAPKAPGEPSLAARRKRRR